MKNHILLSTALALLSQTGIIAAEAIVVDESRPLVELVTQLARKGYLVSYEEAPYDDAALVVEVRPNGLHYRYPGWRSIKFQLPDQAAPDAEPPVGMLEAFIKQYQGSGNPGQFASLSDGEYLHVIPAARISGGVAQNFEPILSTRVSFVAEVRSCNDTLSDLFTKIRAVRGVSMVLGVSPIRQLILGQCVVLGQDLTAREALIQILQQVGASRFKELEPTHFSWLMMYDANVDYYVLNTMIVPRDSSIVPSDLSQIKPALTPQAPPSSPQSGSKGIVSITPVR
jgi:hypothetical protein